MVLVRRRNAFVDTLIRLLKIKSIPVAGSDRLVLTEHIAVMDLMAAGAFALLPEDDLTLATVLRSPLCGLSEDELFDLAYGRPGTLWNALRGKVGKAPRLDAAHALLSGLLARADYDTPFSFYARLLGAEGGRKALRLAPGRGRERSHRRVLGARASLRAAASAFAPRLSPLARSGRGRDQARHGARPRRSARHDRARCQGPAGERRHSAGHLQLAATGPRPGCSRRKGACCYWSPRASDAPPQVAQCARGSSGARGSRASAASLCRAHPRPRQALCLRLRDDGTDGPRIPGTPWSSARWPKSASPFRLTRAPRAIVSNRHKRRRLTAKTRHLTAPFEAATAARLGFSRGARTERRRFAARSRPLFTSRTQTSHPCFRRSRPI